MDHELATLGNRIEIDDLLVRYATAVDARDWTLLDTVFTADARLDYRSAGGIRGAYGEVRDWLASVLPIFTWTQHLVVNRAVDLAPAGDSATAVSIFHNPNGLLVEGRPWLFTVGGRYHDRLARRSDGWRITARVEETTWWEHPMPGLPETPYPLAPDAFD